MDAFFIPGPSDHPLVPAEGAARRPGWVNLRNLRLRSSWGHGFAVQDWLVTVGS
jgi:hypothetical protein